MITQYIAKAMQQATYELLEDGAVYGEKADFSGAGSQGKADTALWKAGLFWINC